MDFIDKLKLPVSGPGCSLDELPVHSRADCQDEESIRRSSAIAFDDLNGLVRAIIDIVDHHVHDLVVARHGLGLVEEVCEYFLQIEIVGRLVRCSVLQLILDARQLNGVDRLSRVEEVVGRVKGQNDVEVGVMRGQVQQAGEQLLRLERLSQYND